MCLCLNGTCRPENFGVTAAAQLEILQDKSVKVLEPLTTTFPNNDVAIRWKSAMAHSILHKMCYLIMCILFWSENFSAQGTDNADQDEGLLRKG
jgi:hypothetical protein